MTKDSDDEGRLVGVMVRCVRRDRARMDRCRMVSRAGVTMRPREWFVWAFVGVLVAFLLWNAFFR